ncbi:methionine adenosyltransferase [bacterium Unc6]|nr:methionine adenosyltransferase [bacterium Unc6]
MLKKYLFTSESVTEGHPDKICDKVADAILDAILEKDSDARVACECLTSTGFIMVAGEITTSCYVDIPAIVRNTLKEIGYTNPEYGLDCHDCGVLTSIHEQSKNISVGVTQTKTHEQGAGDQGMMFGFAVKETPHLMPLPITLAHGLTFKMAEVRKKKVIPWMRPDGKSQVTVEYEDDRPKRIDAIVIAAHHDPKVGRKQMVSDIMKKVIKPVCGRWMDKNTRIFINATGIFAIGGPEADSGLTGRKIIVDTYGGMGHHGGGCFSGKDPSKVDRSGSYMARYIAKNVVAAGLAYKCEVQIAYSIGVAKPVSVSVDTFGTGKILDSKIIELIIENFSLTPAGIIEHLKLKRPIYKKTAAYGHFGRNDPDFTWEKTDKADMLKKRAGL